MPTQPADADTNSCATPGTDGSVNASATVNTYFPPIANSQLSSGATSVAISNYYTEGGNEPITEGDMVMIIQMQDATIDSSNTEAYGSGNPTNGGRGQTSLGNSGIYEFVRATNSVPLTGGTLTFEGGGASDGLINSYATAAPTASQGRRTFQVIRVVQYASLTLTSDITVPDWNGDVGGVLALDIAGNMNFNGFTIDANNRGFRGGFVPNDPSNTSGTNNGNYVLPGTTTEGSGKGEGIAGTPRYMWDGVSAIDLGSDQLPGGDAGRGAPGNAAGGGNAHNAGGGGGGNGGDGGNGGIGWEGAGGDLDGSRGLGGAVPVAAPAGDRLIMGGGGGGGDVNNDANGIRGGQGGGIVYIQADQFVGAGTITSNGSDGEVGEVVSAPDGAGGGGAGGTVALIAQAGNLSGLSVVARGGNGGNTTGDAGIEHGPGGGGGGVVISTSPGGQVPTPDVAGGQGGRANSGAGIPHGAEDGQNGIEGNLNPFSVPPIQPGATCFPSLNVTKTEANPSTPGARPAPDTANYIITVTNTGAGGAADVQLTDELPSGFTYSNGATTTLSGGATGPATPTNSGSASVPVFGDYTIPKDGSVTVNFTVNIAPGTAVGTYQNPAYATYLDPTRTNTDPNRRITAATTPLPGGNTTYESGSNAGNSTPGNNYDSASSTGEDVVIIERTEDYGDAPSSYGDASHDTTGTANIYLGNTADDESATQLGGDAGDGADGDDSDGTDDEDGIIFSPSLSFPNDVHVVQAGITNTVDIEASTTGNLSAWIDYNQDGDFDDAGEQVFTDTALSAGTNSLNLNPTGTILHGPTYARFRFSSQTGLDPTGTANDGEVEDYAVNIAAPVSQVNACGVTGLLNGGFEQPEIATTFGTAIESSGNPRYAIYHEYDVLGWNYTGPIGGSGDVIEIWQEGHGGGETAFDAYEGEQHAEINAYDNGLFFQDVVTTPGATMSWQFFHRGRAGDDTMRLLIGPAGGSTVEQGTYTSGNNVNDPNQGWVAYGGTYVVPANQYVTRFEFEAISTASGSTSVGNFVDDVKFALPLCVPAIATDPSLLLTKRITAINRGGANEQLFDTSYVDNGTASDEDNATYWPGAATPATIGGGTVESYITGIINGADSSLTTRPGDEIEYTIPFLSNGDIAAQDVLICDNIPAGTTFNPTAFNDSTPAGLGAGSRGILVEVNGSQVALTNASDGDEIPDAGGDNGVGGYYFPAGLEPSTLFPDVSCLGTNDNGAVVVDLSDVPNATGDGTPTDSYGFIRFRAVVD